MSALMWWIGIPHRIGFNYKKRSPFLTHKIPLFGYQTKHVVEYYLELARGLGVPIKESRMELAVPAEDRSWAEEIFKKHSLSTEKAVVGIIPGGGASWGKDAKYKRWPAEKYAKLADKIIEKSKVAIILMGDHKEVDLCHEVAGLMKNKVIQLAGQTSITQLAALSSKCRYVIVNDGGPLHVAVAAGATTVSIFGPVDERVYGQLREQTRQELIEIFHIYV
jgi:lipopolysaccharide heptosyltransferase II